MSKKISELTDASTLDGSEQLEVVQSGSNKKVTVNDLLPMQLQEDKTVDANGKVLLVQHGGYDFLRLDPTTDAETAVIAVKNVTGGGNIASIGGLTQATYSNISLISTFNDGATGAQITLQSDADDSYATYSADTHTITGAIITPSLAALDFANDGAAASGGVPVGGLYHTSGTLKIRLS